MPTNRKVIDFKIHNLTEEQFQELKEAGQIDPNAIYCTPDETVANFEAVNARIDETNKKLNTFESGVNETVGVINTTIVNVDKKVDEVIQTEQQHNIAINARVDETVANFEEINTEIEALKDKGGIPLLTPMWTDHTLNDMSWLNADTFSWQSGDVYKAAYEHLFEESNGKEGVSETIAGITVWFVQADDGHKICPAGEEANIQALYEKTGVAWYYIIDEANKQFKLPREAKDGKYLYFYVGNFEREAIEQTAGINAEMFNSKADRELNNVPSNYDYVVASQEPTSANGYTWFRKYKSGWVEQGGRQYGELTAVYGEAISFGIITLPVPMSNGNSYYAGAIGNGYTCLMNVHPSATTIKFDFGAYTTNRTLTQVRWFVAGYAA